MKLSIDVSVVQIDMRQRPDSEKWLVEPRLGSENVMFSRRSHGGFRIGHEELAVSSFGDPTFGKITSRSSLEEFSKFSVAGWDPSVGLDSRKECVGARRSVVVT